jgi:YesN/AraC family two-component response regulator
VLSAENGAEGLRVIERHEGPIDLLVTDVVMPEMSGSALAERAAQLRKGLCVLYMSGYTDHAIERHGVLAPGTHFIAKPFTAGDLARRVRDTLDSRAAP